MKAKLSQRTLGNLGDGVYRDELTKGLYLVIKGGSRAWVLRRQVNGKCAGHDCPADGAWC